METSSREWFQQKYSEYKAAVDRYIEEVSARDGLPEDLRSSSFHLILSGGKRIRPVLLLSTLELLSGGYEEGLPAAASVELLHNFTLIHDDIMDRDDYRRGVKTTHVLFGESLAILAGDYLFSLVFSEVSRNYEGETARMLVKVLSEASEKVCIGQTMDIMPEKYVKSVEDYFEMVYYKTGALIEASMVSGAIVAGGREEWLRDFREVGRRIGIAFQIADDLLGLIGDPSKTGKPVGNDIRNGKRTLPILYALERMGRDELDLFNRYFGREAEDYIEAVELIRSKGGIEYARRTMYEYAGEALSILDKYPDSSAKRFLSELIRYIVDRDR